MYNSNFDELASRLDPMIKKLVNGVHISTYDKDDLYQECLMILDLCNKSYDDSKKTKFTTFFYASAKNRLYDLIRYDKRDKRPELTTFEDVDVLLNDVLDQSIEVEEEDMSDMFFKIIEYLDTMPRGEITKNIYLDEMSVKEVASKHGISVQRVRYLNDRNIEKLKKIFK